MHDISEEASLVVITAVYLSVLEVALPLPIHLETVEGAGLQVPCVVQLVTDGVQVSPHSLVDLGCFLELLPLFVQLDLLEVDLRLFLLCLVLKNALELQQVVDS